MTDSTSPAPSGAADVNPNDLQAVADAIPRDAFSFFQAQDEERGEAPDAPAQTDDGGDQGSDRQARAREQHREQGRFARAPEQPEGQDAQPEEAQAAPEPEQAAEDGAEPQPKPDAPQEQAGATLTLKDGRKVTAEDYEREALFQGDYTKKTQALADTARRVQGYEQQLQAYYQQIEIERQQTNALMEIARGALQQRMRQKPDPAMIRTDWIGYQEQMAAYEAEQAELQQLVQAQAQVSQQDRERQQREARQREQTLQEQQRQREDDERQAKAVQQQALRQKMPALFTEQGAQAFFGRVEKHSKDLGIGVQDLVETLDHRAYPVVELAMKYLEAQVNRSSAVQRAQGAPPLRPAARQSPGAASSQANKQAQERFNRDPSVENLAAMLPSEMFRIDA